MKKKLNKNNNEIKRRFWWLYLTNFYKKLPLKLEMQFKKDMYVFFI